jgi:hypothetical protein
MSFVQQPMSGGNSHMDRYEVQPFAFAPPTVTSTNPYGYREAGSSMNNAGNIGPPMPFELLSQAGHNSDPQHPSFLGSTFDRNSNSRNGRSLWDTQGSQQQQQHMGAYTPAFATNHVGHPSTTMQRNSIFAPPSEVASSIALPEATALLHSAVSGSSHFAFSAPMASDDIADYDWLFDGIDPLIPAVELETGNGAEDLTSARSETSTARDTQLTDDTHDHMVGMDDATSEDVHLSSAQLGETDALHDLAFFASLQSEIPDEDTYDIDSLSHARILHFLGSSMPELATTSLFSPPALRCYIYLYFTKFNAIYPLIHKASFVASSADPMLLSAMIICGAHFADESAHFLAERIGRKLWGAFITFEDFRPARATLAMLQAMLLTESFGKLMGTRPQHETAHLFHNFIVTLARRNAVFVPSKTKLPHGPLDERWRAWAREEEKKRISLFAFMRDAQDATIFRHIPALSSFQIHLSLPCDDEEWIASSAEAWHSLRQEKRTARQISGGGSSSGDPPSFIAAVKAMLTPGIAPRIGSDSDSFKHMVLLHGLMSVAYDLQWKQQALLAASDSSDSMAKWKQRLTLGYQACMDRFRTLGEPTRLIDRASYSLIEISQIVLHADPVDIQIYAGLPSVIGRFIDHHTFSVARRACREWARTDDARKAVWLSARFLSTSLFADSSTVAGEDQQPSASPGPSDLRSSPSHNGYDELLHQHWIQYLCALIIWTYEQAITPLNRTSITLPISRPRSRERDADQESTTSASSNTGGVNGGNSSAHATPNVSSTVLQRDTAISFGSVIAVPFPSLDAPLQDYANDARHYFSTVLQNDPDHSSPHTFQLPHNNVGSTAVLVLVERRCRMSRWEIGREASGVIRKLIRERHNATAAANANTTVKAE